MTPQEQQLLMQLTQRINETQLQEKDPDAENLLGRELGANSDALYIMAQTVLVQNMALDNLKAQVVQLQQQLQQARQQPAHSTSFLGRLLGEHDKPQAQPPPPVPYQPQQQAGWQQVPQAAPPQYQQAPPQYAQSQYFAVPAGQPSFFRGAMQTAAGVAAGALAFEGVESLLHGGFGHGGGWGGPGYGMGPGAGFGGGFERPIEETVVNNYYDSPGAGPMGGGEHHVEHNYGGGQDFGGGHYEGGERHFQNTDGSGAVYSDADYTTQGGDNNTQQTDAPGADQSAGAWDQGAYDNGMENDTTASDNSAADVQIDDSQNGFDDGSSGGFDSGGGFDDGGGGFDSGGGDSSF